MPHYSFPTPWFETYRKQGIPADLSVRPTEPIYSLPDSAARDYPDRPAIIYDDTVVTYAELKELSDRFAGALKRIGVKRGERVAVMLPNLPQTIVAFWGVIKAGAVLVMTNPFYMETEIAYNMNDSGAKYMVLADTLWAKVSAIRPRIPIQHFIITDGADGHALPYAKIVERAASGDRPQGIVWSSTVHSWAEFIAGAEPCVPKNFDPEDVILFQYTGGTTGVSKGVMLTHANMVANCRQFMDHMHLYREKEEVLVSIMPFFHVYGLTVGLVLSSALACGTVPIPRYVPLDMLRILSSVKATMFVSAPAVFTSLLQQKTLGDYDLTSIRLCVSGSAPLPAEVSSRFSEISGAYIVEGYGLTEASPVTHFTPMGVTSKVCSIGVPLPGTIARIVDMDNGELDMPVGKVGELIVRGPQVMRGYWKRPDETANALRNGWLYTGDIAMMDDEGYFYIVDRKKDMAIVGGYNVYPREVDEVLMSHPGIAEAVTVGIPEGIRGEVLKAFIVPKADYDLRKSDIVAFCRKKLAPYKVPRNIEFRDELPRTAVGKILRRALRDEEQKKRAEKEASR